MRKSKPYRTPEACYRPAPPRLETPRESFYRQEGQLPYMMGVKIKLPPFVKGQTYQGGEES